MNPTFGTFLPLGCGVTALNSQTQPKQRIEYAAKWNNAVMTADTLVDTSIFFDYQRAGGKALSYFNEWGRRGRLAAHIVTKVEVLSKARNLKEQQYIETIFKHFLVLWSTEPDAQKVLEFFKRYRLSHEYIHWHDCLIAATSLSSQMRIATLNIKHFAVFEGLNSFRPY